MGNLPNGPYETEQQARAAAHQVVRPEPGWSILRAPANRELLRRALDGAGVETGAFENRIAEWMGQWEDAVCAVVAGWVTRAAAGKPGPHAVVLDLAGDDGTAYFVLQAALGDFAARQREQARAEDGSEHREAWATRADQILAAVEDAMDGDR